MSELSVGSLSGLAANSYVIDVASGSTLDLSAGAVFPAGSILQVVSATKTDTTSVAISSGAFSSNISGLEATITPTSATSKILVTVAITISRSDSRAIGFFRIMRDATPIGLADAAGSRPQLTHGSLHGGILSLNLSQSTVIYQDSPATTSAITYGVQLYGLDPYTFHVNRSTGDANDNTGPRTVSTITVMEVAG